MLARRYHLQRVLGRGAMGAVWEAEDTFLRRTVAVKEVVLPGSLSPEERAVSCERTLREARAIARLGHPNVVTLFDVLDEDARPWVVMELVPSRSLAEVIKEDGPLHPLRVATVGLAILGALEAAHAASITHRDVKPGNILLGHDGRVKLTDFGIARAAGDDTITGTGLLVGSPSYIAPEIVKGLEAGAPADLWGLGATLYAAVEGRAPFSGADAMETLSKVVQEPAAPYERAGPLVPALDAMLEKDPARRARPVDARRALLDVLRGGSEAEAPARSAPAPVPPAPAPAPAEAPAPSGPGLADLLVPVWRQDRHEESPAPAPATSAAGAAAAPATAVGTATGAATGPAADEPGDVADEAGERSDAAGSPVGGLAAAAGAVAPRRETGTGASGAGADEAVDAFGDEGSQAPESVAGSTIGERAREVLAGDDDLVDPDVADPDLVGADVAGGTRADLGRSAPADTDAAATGTAATGTAPAEAAPAGTAPAGSPAGAPAAAAGAAFAGAAGSTTTTTTDAPHGADEDGEGGGPDVGAESDPDATVTLPARPLPAGTPHPQRTPAYGSYGGSGDADPRTQRIAPLPFGPPQTTQQPARAFRPQPPSSPLDFQDERPRGDRRKRSLAALLAVVVLVAVVLVGGFLLIRGLRGGDGGAGAGGTPSASTSLGPATIPSGYTRYPGSGFTVGVPDDWPTKEQRDGVVDAREPGTTRFLRLITVDSTASALTQLSAAEKQFAADPSYGSYQRVKLEKVDYRGLDAADWEFTFTLDGVARHVLYRGIVTDGRTFGLYLSTPADDWKTSTDVFQVAADTFRTG
jgi:hypothetical protein